MYRNSAALLDDIFRYLDDYARDRERLFDEPDNAELRDSVTAATRFVEDIERKIETVMRPQPMQTILKNFPVDSD